MVAFDPAGLGEKRAGHPVQRFFGIAKMAGGGRDSGGIEPWRLPEQRAGGGSAESGVMVGRIAGGLDAGGGDDRLQLSLAPAEQRAEELGAVRVVFVDRAVRAGAAE